MDVYPSSFAKSNQSPGEFRLFNLLRNSKLMDGWKVHHSFVTPNHKSKKWGEIDFIFIIPNKGIVCLEIKSHKFIEYKGGEWYFANKKSEDPFKQVMSASEALKSRLIDHRPWIKNIPWFHGVMFTDSEIPSNYEPMQFERWQFLGPNNKTEEVFKKSIIDLSEKGMIAQNRGRDVSEIADDGLNQLNNLLLNECIFHSSPITQRDINFQNLILVSNEQLNKLRYISSNKKIYIDGYAGSGKTIIAISEAKRLANENEEVLFICPSEVLKTSLMKGELGSLSNVKICSLNDLEEDQDIFHEEKVIIVDEAQDIFFKKENFNKINNILGNFFYDNSSVWRLFGDSSRQKNLLNLDDDISSKYKEVGFVPENTVKVILRDNYRNKKMIVNRIKQYCNIHYEGIKRLEYDEDAFIPVPYATREDQLTLVLEKLDEFKNYPDEDKVILSPYNETSLASEFINEFKTRGFDIDNKNFGDRNSIFFDTISNFKGLEKPLVFITDFDKYYKNENVNNNLYTALTRSIDKAFLFFDENNFLKD